MYLKEFEILHILQKPFTYLPAYLTFIHSFMVPHLQNLFYRQHLLSSPLHLVSHALSTSPPVCHIYFLSVFYIKVFVIFLFLKHFFKVLQ